MRVGLLTAGLLLTSAIISQSDAAIVNMSPPPPPKSQTPGPALPPVPLPPAIPAPPPTAEAPAQSPAKASPKVASPIPAKAPAKVAAPVPAKAAAPTKIAAPTKAPAPAKVAVPAPAKAEAPTKVATPVPAKVIPKVAAPTLAKAIAPTKAKVEAKATCPCNCPKDHAAGQRTQAHLALRQSARRYADSGYYNYRAAAPVIRHEWHGQWRAAPNDAYIPGPMTYGPPPYGYEPEGLQVDDRGWTGGVGAASDGSGGGGFADGYGQVHFANSGSVDNGPSYNSYGQSFQFNPSQAGPFQPRLMGGIAPASSGSR